MPARARPRSLLQALSLAPSAGQPMLDKAGSLAKEFLTPTVKLEFRKPTLGACRQ